MTVATVRPETMVADTGVAVHPDDDRYEDRIGRTVLLPIMGRELPVVADDSIRPEFGTGAVKVTPGHDPVDYERGQAYSFGAIPFQAGQGQNNGDKIYRFDNQEYAKFPAVLATNFIAP